MKHFKFRMPIERAFQDAVALTICLYYPPSL